MWPINTIMTASIGVGVASAISIPRHVTSPSVEISNGTVVGQSDGHIDNFIGVPFARPPVDGLRLKPAQSIEESFGTLILPPIAAACPQQSQTPPNTTGLPGSAIDALSALAMPVPEPVGEDCLTVTIQRPAGTTDDSKLPVLFWLFGGGFQFGSTSSYNATNIVKRSMDLGTPIIYVAANYRLSAFGFLPGKELQDDDSTNLGLRDQRMALHWVAENIEAFGGDPDRVTIWGESAGSYSVYDQLLVNEGNNTYNGKELFRGAIMDSGFAYTVTPIDSKPAQDVYDGVVVAAGCAQAADSLECLRSVPYETFLNASNSQRDVFSFHGLAEPYLPRPDPSSNFFSVSPELATANGKFARATLILGDQEDEGSLFSLIQRNISTTDQLVDFLLVQYPLASRDEIRTLVNTYSDDPVDGSPYRTGTDNQLYPEFKRLAAIEGDVIFQWTRRQSLAVLSAAVPCWSFLATYLFGTQLLGTSHFSDVVEIYRSPADSAVAKTIDSYYINFVVNLDPNGKDLGVWPKYDNTDLRMLNLSANGTSILKDDYRQSSYEYFVNNLVKFALP